MRPLDPPKGKGVTSLRSKEESIRTFPRITNLSPKEKIVQEKSIRKVLAMGDKMVDEYIKNPRLGNVINTDNFRRFFIREGYRGYNSASVQKASNYLTKKAWKKIIETSDNPDAIFFAGGSGTGKSSTIKKIDPDYKKNAAGVLDGNLSSIKSARENIAVANNAGKKEKFKYVYRDPIESFMDGVVKRMSDNKEEMGRVVPIKEVVENHKGSLDVIKQLYNEYSKAGMADRFKFYNNSLGKDNAVEVGIDFVKKIRYNDNIEQQLRKAVKNLYENRKLTKEQYEAYIQS